VGGVFNAVNPAVYASRASPDNPRYVKSFDWLKDWARLAGLPLQFPSPHHPLKSVKAMRACCALEEDQAALHSFATHAFAAYFRDQRNLDDATVLAAVADECGLDGAALIALSETESIKNHLRANTEEAIARGSFGSPTLFVEGGAMFFGNDQLPLVRQALMEADAVQGAQAQ
jgi:2-hydroxychromene-2-carboxylate isomerase